MSVFCSVLPNGRPVPIREHEDSNFPRSWPTLTSPADVKSELIVALICLSQMVEDAEHFLMSCCPLSPSSVDYNFTLLTVSFNAWSIHTLIMSMHPLLFCHCASNVLPRKPLPTPKVTKIHACFLLRCFYGFHSSILAYDLFWICFAHGVTQGTAFLFSMFTFSCCNTMC